MNGKRLVLDQIFQKLSTICTCFTHKHVSYHIILIYPCSENRIEANRRNGQLLVISKKFESLTELPIDNNDDNDEYAENSTKTVRQESDKNSSTSLNDDEDEMKSSNETEETLVSSFSIDDERQARESEEFSCLTKSTNHVEHSVDMMNAIKGLGEKFEILDRRLSIFPPPQPTPGQQVTDPNTIEELKGKIIQISRLSKRSLKLEKDKDEGGVIKTGSKYQQWPPPPLSL